MTSSHTRTGATTQILLPILIVTWIASVAYMYPNLMRGWVPHDEGALAQAAERVLQGELPHRDFDDIYTGGLALFDAAAFRMFGTNLASLRWPMFLFFAAWVPALFYVASRFVSPLSSAAVTLLAVAWSVPNYAAPIPSWYNLFFAVFGAAALLRYLANNGTFWLFVAGICGGLSCLAKVTGLYYVAAVLLFFVFREQALIMENPEGSSPRRFRFYSVAVVAGLLAFLLLVLKTVDWSLDWRRFVHFELPSLTLVILLLLREATMTRKTDKQRFTNLLRMCLPFLAGVLLPIVVFLLPYIMTHSVQSLITGVFVSHQKRLTFAMMAPLPHHPLHILGTLGLLALLYGTPKTSCPTRWRQRMEFFLFLSGAIIFTGISVVMYQFIWSSVVLLIPATAVAGSLLLWKDREPARINSVRQQQVFMLLAIVGVCSLVQFPFSAPIYFCYVAPLLVLAMVAVISSRERQLRYIHGGLLVFYIAFAVLYATPWLHL